MLNIALHRPISLKNVVVYACFNPFETVGEVRSKVTMSVTDLCFYQISFIYY